MSVSEQELQQLPYFDRNLGGRIWTPTCRQNVLAFIRDIKATALYQEVEASGRSIDLDAVLEYALTKFKEPLHFADYTRAMERLVKHRGLGLEPIEEPVADTRPRNAQGQYLSAQEIQDQEFTAWSNAKDTSMAMIKQRRNSDRAYNDFYNRQTSLRLQEENKESLVQPGRSADPTTDGRYDTALIAFADKYRKMSMDEVRKQKNAATNPSGHLLFNSNLDRAMACGLI
jgi:hypothetical protein